MLITIIIRRFEAAILYRYRSRSSGVPRERPVLFLTLPCDLICDPHPRIYALVCCGEDRPEHVSRFRALVIPSLRLRVRVALRTLGDRRLTHVAFLALRNSLRGPTASSTVISTGGRSSW